MTMHIFTKAPLVALGLTLMLSAAGCITQIDGTSIQKKYVDRRDNCRGFAERNVESYRMKAMQAQAEVQKTVTTPADYYVDYYGRKLQVAGGTKKAAAPQPAAEPPAKPISTTAALTTLFSDCMNSKGWIVATPRQPVRIPKPANTTQGTVGYAPSDSLALGGGRGR